MRPRVTRRPRAAKRRVARTKYIPMMRDEFVSYDDDISANGVGDTVAEATEATTSTEADEATTEAKMDMMTASVRKVVWYKENCLGKQARPLHDSVLYEGRQ